MSGLEYNAGSDLIPEERSMNHSEFKESSWSLAEAHRGRLNFSLFQFHPLVPLMTQKKERPSQKCNKCL